jgi:hypothetical protein
VRFCEKCLQLTEQVNSSIIQHFEDFISNKEAYLTNPYAALIASLQEVLYYVMLVFLIKGDSRNQLYRLCSSLSVDDWEKSLLDHLKDGFIKKAGPTFLRKIFLFKDVNGKGFPCAVRRSCLLIISSLNNNLSSLQMPTL